jgi:hypothetical protein
MPTGGLRPFKAVCRRGCSKRYERHMFSHAAPEWILYLVAAKKNASFIRLYAERGGPNSWIDEFFV